MKTKVTTWMIALAACWAMTACFVSDDMRNKTLYDFTAVAHNDEHVPLDKYRGQVVLVVNTASQCRFTPQYADLQRLYEKYADLGFDILDFPCNQFGSQSPETDAETVQFCKQNYGTKFAQYKKVEVNGENEIPLYTWLKSQHGFDGFDKPHPMRELDSIMRKSYPDYKAADIRWNFTKFLIDRNGKVIARYEPVDNLEDIEAAIVNALQ